MRIVTWNCNQAFRKKIEPLIALDPDVAVIQECERSFTPPSGYSFIWHGVNPNKGLGVLSKSPIVPLHHHVLEQSAFFLPVVVPALKLRLLAVWAFNHRAERFEPRRSGSALDAITHLQQWLSNHRSAVAGDFNNNASWDKALKPNNFREISARLGTFGLTSAYHTATGEDLGRESIPTHYWRKSDLAKYHIDYCFLHRSIGPASLSIPTFEAWRSLSDHVPVITEIA